MADYNEKIKKLVEKKKVSKIVDFLKSKNKEERICAMRALGEVGGEIAVNNLTLYAIAQDPDERKEAIKALGNCGTDATFSLLSHYLVNEKDPEVLAIMKEAQGRIHARVKERQ